MTVGNLLHITPGMENMLRGFFQIDFSKIVINWIIILHQNNKDFCYPLVQCRVDLNVAFGLLT